MPPCVCKTYQPGQGQGGDGLRAGSRGQERGRGGRAQGEPPRAGDSDSRYVKHGIWSW